MVKIKSHNANKIISPLFNYGYLGVKDRLFPKRTVQLMEQKMKKCKSL